MDYCLHNFSPDHFNWWFLISEDALDHIDYSDFHSYIQLSNYFLNQQQAQHIPFTIDPNPMHPKLSFPEASGTLQALRHFQYEFLSWPNPPWKSASLRACATNRALWLLPPQAPLPPIQSILAHHPALPILSSAIRQSSPGLLIFILDRAPILGSNIPNVSH